MSTYHVGKENTVETHQGISTSLEITWSHLSILLFGLYGSHKPGVFIHSSQVAPFQVAMQVAEEQLQLSTVLCFAASPEMQKYIKNCISPQGIVCKTPQ